MYKGVYVYECVYECVHGCTSVCVRVHGHECVCIRVYEPVRVYECVCAVWCGGWAEGAHTFPAGPGRPHSGSGEAQRDGAGGISDLDTTRKERKCPGESLGGNFQPRVCDVGLAGP